MPHGWKQQQQQQQQQPATAILARRASPLVRRHSNDVPRIKRRTSSPRHVNADRGNLPLRRCIRLHFCRSVFYRYVLCLECSWNRDQARPMERSVSPRAPSARSCYSNHRRATRVETLSRGDCDFCPNRSLRVQPLSRANHAHSTIDSRP